MTNLFDARGSTTNRRFSTPPEDFLPDPVLLEQDVTLLDPAAPPQPLAPPLRGRSMSFTFGRLPGPGAPSR